MPPAKTKPGLRPNPLALGIRKNLVNPLASRRIVPYMFPHVDRMHHMTTA